MRCTYRLLPTGYSTLEALVLPWPILGATLQRYGWLRQEIGPFPSSCGRTFMTELVIVEFEIMAPQSKCCKALAWVMLF